MYDEAADFAEHRAQLESMDATLAECGVTVDWGSATVCDVGGGGGLRAALLAARAKRTHCADISDQELRYNGEFVKLLSEKMERHGHHLPMDRFEFNVADATRLMFRNDWFDFVCAVNAFEHIRDPEAALREIARVLSPGGYAYVSFDPIWTADTGNHFQHRVADPWAHLVLSEAEFIASMRLAGAEAWEVEEFRGAMNRRRLPVYEHLFRVTATELGLELLLCRSWSGVVNERSLQHPNFSLALQAYTREELMTRGMVAVLRKHPELREEPATPHHEAQQARPLTALQRHAPQFVPPGHFYSPIPALDDVLNDEARIFAAAGKQLPAIDLREDAQLELMSAFKRFHDAQPFPAQREPRRRYYFENPNYSYSDALVLHCMIRHASPKRIIEIGSGYSSCVMLDTNELYFDGQIACTFIEPYPDLLRSLLRQDDGARVEILAQRVQDVDIGRFRRLDSGDVLFIDSTHVSKVGSDVNHIIFEILPSLRPGVFVHFHDVFFPFEYPKQWIVEGRSWTEGYLLRAFLEYNEGFEIVFFNTFLEQFHADRLRTEMPLCLKGGGGSLWIRKRR